MKIFILALLQILCITSVAVCQVPDIETESWSANPTLSRVDEKYGSEPAVTIMNKVRYEYIDDKSKNLNLYITQHKIIHLNNDQGIEYYNKVYISVSDFSDVQVIKARAILPGGKIVEINQSTIKDLKEENGSLYKIFAFEGLEKGSDIEYYYTLHRSVTLMGRFNLEDRFPAKETSFEIITPDRLVFEAKSYHCESAIQTDTLVNKKARLLLHVGPISGLDDEKYASYKNNLARVEFKLSYNNATHPGQRIYTWNEYAKGIFTVYGVYTEKEINAIADLIKNNQWDQLSGDSAKVVTVENYLKKTIVFRKELASEGANNIPTILKSRLANGTGMMRLYGAIYKGLNVNYQFVLAADREESEVDREFENWNNCDNEMIYFPSLHHFIEPTQSQYRYPWIPSHWGDGYAMFCKNISIGSMNSAIAEIKYIPLENFQQSYDNIEGKLFLNSSLDSLILDMKFIYGGYAATGIRNAFNLMTTEEVHNSFKNFAKTVEGTETILSSSIENRAYEDANSRKPFILNLKLRSGDFIERAGNKLLFKIGMVIGPQNEMYQEKERRLPIYMPYPHYEHRKLEFTIPEGYVIKNPDDLKRKQVYEENGAQTMGFVSDYTINGNLLTIDIMEDYRKSSFPVSQYADFRGIINASSDFNKIVLILEKK